MRHPCSSSSQSPCVLPTSHPSPHLHTHTHMHTLSPMADANPSASICLPGVLCTPFPHHVAKSIPNIPQYPQHSPHLQARHNAGVLTQLLEAASAVPYLARLLAPKLPEGVRHAAAELLCALASREDAKLQAVQVGVAERA